MITKEELLRGLRCETCSENRVFGKVPNSEPDNLYVYTDLTGRTRCFCKEHISFYDGTPKWGAVLLSEVLKHEDEN